MSEGMLPVRRGKEGKAGPQGRSLPKINYSPMLDYQVQEGAMGREQAPGSAYKLDS